MSLTRALAENIVRTNYESLPVPVIEKTKRQILDILGVMFPPSTLERACIALEEIAKEGGGKPESTFIAFGGRGPCWMAAFVNGSLCHPLDYDDSLDEFSGHASGHAFPAAFAVAERLENVTGKEFITAVALGIDLNVRLCAVLKGSSFIDYPWFPITVFGSFSATAAAGKILGLTTEEMVNAFGITLDRTSGITESMTSPDSEVRAIRDGFTNREGVFAGLMAKKGITACKEGIEKLYKIFYGNNYDSSSLTSNLGVDFLGLKVGFKPWPCARPIHTYIKAALNILAEYDLQAGNIDEVVLTVGKHGRDILFSPLEEKRRPKLGINAKLSLPFVMGVALTKKRVTIEDFLSKNLEDPEVLEIAGKVKCRFDPELIKRAFGPGIVEIRTRDGRSFSKRVDIPYGHPENPMSDAELLLKFKDCARYAKKSLPMEKVNHLSKEILALERVENMKEIGEMLA